MAVANPKPLDEERALELSVVMPCLNEAETLATCIEKAQRSMREHNIKGEVLIADNGSTDGSPEIAKRLGARVVNVEAKGYGNALMGGIAATRGKYIIMGDADDSYDFANLYPFVEKLRVTSLMEISVDTVLTWRQDFAQRALGAWEAGGDIWLSKRIFAARPRPEWNWVEGDDGRVSWADFAPFFAPLEMGEAIGGEDGFVLLLPTPANKQILETTVQTNREEK